MSSPPSSPRLPSSPRTGASPLPPRRVQLTGRWWACWGHSSPPLAAAAAAVFALPLYQRSVDDDRGVSVTAVTLSRPVGLAAISAQVSAVEAEVAWVLAVGTTADGSLTDAALAAIARYLEDCP